MSDLLWMLNRLEQRVQAPQGYGGQCVDLVRLFLLGRRGLAANYGDAAQWAGVAIHGARWVENGPANFPTAGDIVVWRGTYVPLRIAVAGHIGLAVAADASALVTCDQNWPVGAPVSLVAHDFRDVAGWHHWGG